jgi:creatinine amidohydrolase
MTLPKRDWMEMTWADIAAAGEAVRRWIAVLPLAAVEQHGPHLPLGVDAYIAEAYLARVRKILPEALPVTFLPVQRVGVSAEHLCYPGALTLSATTAIKAWTEIGESLARAGLRKLLLVTSHGGNVAAMELVARDLRTRLGMLAVTVAMAREFKWLGAYRPAGFAWMTQDLNATGAVGDATQASAAKGEAALAHGAQEGGARDHGLPVQPRCRYGAGSAHLQDLWLRRHPGHDPEPISPGA